MDNKKQNTIFKIFAFIFIILVISSIAVSIILFTKTTKSYAYSIEETTPHDYHVIVTGTYENHSFLEQVYEGAKLYSDQYNAVVELYVPGSQAEDVPLQTLLDYVSFVNADGVIVFNDAPDSILTVPAKVESESIPLITTGQYNPNLQQISYIGTSYWELGKKIATEANAILHGNGNILIICNEYLSSLNYANLMNSMLDVLRTQKGINHSIITDISDYNPTQTINLLVCLSEEDTIKTAQKLQDLELKNPPRVLGFGTNETCQLYLEKGIVTELVDVDPFKIGVTAIRELFEYRNSGYANSYIAADVQFLRSEN